MKLSIYVISFVVGCSSLSALPEGGEVASGHAQLQQIDPKFLKIIADDRTIINYKSFNIGKKETVQILQPSHQSILLNRIKGKNPTEIFGTLNANGRIFLVNPQGIYFGPDAVVNTGSLIASTLNISDEDFLNDRFDFFLEPGSEQAKILNEGMLQSNRKGFIALISPVIENRGSVLAYAGKAIFASGEKVVLDFSGDGLIQFTVDGKLRQALIENYGQIEALGGAVELSMRTARDSIKMVVNTDGILVADAIEEFNGVIRLVNTSQIAAERVKIEGREGSRIELDGNIDASNFQTGFGGSVEVLGDSLDLIHAKIDVSGDKQGGTVLIGGDYQGQGDLYTAKTTVMQAGSKIIADAHQQGDGGKVILWSDDTTVFDGQIYARGGKEAGNGGFVETSGDRQLGCQFGFVDTSAPFGNFGQWLLDPQSINIVTGGGATLAQCSAPNCATNTTQNIDPATIAASLTNVSLCATRNPVSSITVTNAITMTNPGVTLTLTAGSTNVGNINLNNNITTVGGAISLVGVVVVGANVTLDTTNAGGTAAGANISFSNRINGANALTLQAGTAGTISFSGAIGGTTPLTNLSFTSANLIQVGNNITVSGANPLVFSSPVSLTGTSVITSNSTNVTFSSTLNGAQSLTLVAGAGATTFNGSVGGVTPLTNLAFTSANLIQVGNNITVSGANPLVFSSPVSLIGTSTITSNNANVTFSSTLNGAQALTIAGGTGTTTFTGAVGGTTPLTSLSVIAATVTQTLTAKTTGAISYTGSTLINIGGNETTSGGVITLTGPVILSGNPTLDTTNAGGTAAGANISFSSTVNGATALTLQAGTAGTTSFAGAVGGTTPLTNLSFTSASLIQVGNNITVSGANPLVFSSPVSLTGTSTITSNNANVTFSSTLNGAQALTVAGGTGTTTFTGAVGGTTPLTSLSVTAATVTQTLTAKTTGSISYTGSTLINIGGNVTTSGGVITLTGPVILSGNPTLDTTNAGGTATGANISFSSTVNGATALTLQAGTAGTISFTGAVGGMTPLTNLSFTSANLIQVGNNITVSGANPLVFSRPVSLTGTSTITSNNADVIFSSTLNGAQALTIVGGTGTVTFTGAVGGTTPLTNLSFTSANLIQVGNNITVSGANPLVFSRPVSLTGTSTITSNNANITFSSTLNGAQSSTINAGTGTATFTGAIGGITPLNSLTVTAGTINQTLNATTTGPLTYTAPSAINLSGNVTTSGNAITMTGPVTFFGNTTFDTTNSGAVSGGANITIIGTLNGSDSLTLNAGTGGGVSITGGIGGLTPLNSLSITGFIVNQSSSIYVIGALSYTGSTLINIGGSITTNGGVITLTGPVTISNNPTFDTTNSGAVSSGANISFSSTLNGITALILNAGTAGNVNFSGAIGETNALTNLSFLNANRIDLGNNVVVTGANPLIFSRPVRLTGSSSNITSNHANITFNSTVDGDVALTRTLRMLAGTGNITLTGAVGGTTSLALLEISSVGSLTANAITAGALSQLAGSGTSTFNGAIGISGLSGINLTGTNFNFNNTITATGGDVSIANSGLLSMGNSANFTLSGAYSQTGSGNVQSGNTITAAGGILFTSPVALTNHVTYSTATGPQVITFLSTIDSISTTPFNLTLDAGTSNIILNDDLGSIHPLGAFLVNQANNLTTEGIIANSATLNGGTGTTTINGNVLIGSGGISLTGNNFVNNGDVIITNGGSVTINNTGTATRSPGHTANVSGNYSIIGTGPVFAGSGLTVGGNILINPPVTLVSDTTLDTSGGGGDITFSSAINGPYDFTLIAGTGSILFSGHIGSSVAIGDLTISSANNVTTQDIHAASITQLLGTGTTLLNGALTTSSLSGISITTNVVTRGAAITAIGGGGLTITNSGALTSTASGAITLAGAFTQNGTGPVSLGGSIITQGSNISFASPVTLAANVTLSTAPDVGGDITFSQTVQGGFSLTLLSGIGNITFAGNVGTLLTPLTGLTITRAENASIQTLFSSFITQSIGTGTTTFNGPVTATGASGISLTGSHFTFNDTLTTLLGAVSITNSGVLTFATGATGSIAGGLTQNGIGSVQLSSSLTAGGDIHFDGAVVVSGTGSLSTQAANQPITFLSTVNGPGNLSLSSGTAAILFDANAGGTTPLGNVLISTVDNLTLQALTASSFTQTAGTGTTLVNSTVTTSGAGGIQLTGNAFTFLSDVTASGSGSISIANAGLLTTTPGTTLSGNAGISQTGPGVVSLGSHVTANNQDISFASPITLTANVILNSGTSAGDIIIDTVDGNFDLTFTAGRDIFAGAIGGVTRVGVLTATTVRNNNASSMSAEGIFQFAGTGTTTLNGNMDTNTPAGIHLVGTNFVRSGSITTTNGGSFSVTNSGFITGTSINTTSIDGTYTQTGVGPSATYNLAGTVSARLGIVISSPVTLISDLLNLTPIILDTSTGNGDIHILGAIDNNLQAPHTLILRTGVGDIQVDSDIGGSQAIGSLVFGNIEDMSFEGISAASIQQEALTTIIGQATFNGPLNITDAAGINLSGNSFTFDNSVTTTGGGTVSIANTGLLEITSSSVFNLDGAFSQTSSGTVSLGGSITTTADAISFASPITLIANSALNSGLGVGDITLAGSLDGAFSFDITADLGDLFLQSEIGQTTPLSTLTINSANDVLVDGGLTVTGDLTISSSSGTMIFNEPMIAGSMNINGTTIDINNNLTTTSGSIALTNSGVMTIPVDATVISTTSFAQSGSGTLTLGANITTTGNLSIQSATTLTHEILLQSGGGDITLSNTVGGAFDVTLTAGSGDVILSGNIGVPRVGLFTITSAHDITVQSITANSLNLINATGTATLNGNLDTNGILGIAFIGNQFVSSGSITTSNGGPFTLTNSGLVTATGSSTIILNGGGEFIQNGTGPVNLGGSLTTQNGNISHSSPVEVLLPTTFTSNGGGILFANTIDGPDCLTLIAGTGDVQLDGIVGGTTPLSCLAISADQIFQNAAITTIGDVQETATLGMYSNANITTNGGNLDLVGEVHTTASVTFSTVGGAGNISVTGTINPDVAGRNLTLQAATGDVTLSGTVGGNTSFNNFTVSGNNISWANYGSLVPGAIGTTTLTATNDINFTGTSYNSGTQSYTAGGNFNFTAGAPTSIVSSMAPITFNTGTLQLGSTDLSIDSNGGNITIPTLLGPGRNLTIDADIGNFTFTQIGAFSNNLNVVDLTANSFPLTPILNSNIFANTLNIQSVTPLVISTNQMAGTITYNAPLIIQGDISYTCGASGTITFNKRVDANTAGVDTLTFDFNPCTGSINFNAPVGSVAPLAAINIDSSVDVLINSTMDVGSFSVINGTGTVTINAGMTSTALGGVAIDTPIINCAGMISTANLGPVSLSHSGALTIAAGTILDVSGAFQELGSGSVSMGGSIITHDTNMTFTGPVTLNSTTTLTTKDALGGNLSFADTIDGAFNLTLLTGTGDVTFTGALGSSTPLLDLIITQANHLTTSSSIAARTITQLSGTTSSTFHALTTTGLSGISLIGNAFNFNGNITTSGNGPFVLNQTGQAVFTNAVYSINGAFQQTGSGSTKTAGTFTTGGSIQFSGNVILAGSTSFDSSSNSQNITFNSTLVNDTVGAYALTLNTGSNGDIICSGAIGTAPDEIGAMTIVNARHFTAGAISAASLTQTAGSGTTSISGALTTTDVAGIHLTSDHCNLNSTVITSNGGPLSITNASISTLNFGNGTLISGPFTQIGGGSISLSGTLATNNQNISFLNPITLSGATTLSSGAGGGTITLSSSVNGNQSFTLLAGTGNIVFGGNLGETTTLGAFTITSVNNISYPLVHAASLIQQASSGSTTITGPIETTGALGVSVTGGVINQNGAITTTNAGSISFVNSGLLTVGSGVNTISGSSYSQTGGGSVILGGSIQATNSSLLVSGPISLTANVSLSTGPTHSINNQISLVSAVTGGFSLSLTAPGGTVSCAGNVGTLLTPLTAWTVINAKDVTTQAIFANAITQQLGTGVTTFNGGLNASSLSGISLIGAAFTFNNTITSTGPLVLNNSSLATFNSGATTTLADALTQNGLGSIQLSNLITAGGAVTFVGPCTLSGSSSISTQAANQPIQFLNALNGPGHLTLSSGTQDILFQQNAGSTTRLGNLSITTVRNWTTKGVNSSSILQSAGSNLTFFNGDLDTNGLSGIQLTGNQFTFLGNVNTTGGGGVQINNSGTLTTTSGKSFSSNGPFIQNGSGNVVLASGITTTNTTSANANISFSGSSPITLTAPISINSSAGGGTITFAAASTVNGLQALTLSAGTGNIDILGDFGGITPIGAFTISNAHDVQCQLITASSITQLAGTGTTSLLGSIATNTPTGITLIGNQFTTGPLALSIVTTNTGSFTLTNQGIVSSTVPIAITIDGSFVQNGPGPVVLTSVTARNGISLTGPAILAANTLLDTTSGNGGILFSNILSGLAGTESLTVNSGAGDIAFSQPIGLTTMIGGTPVTAIGSLTANGEIIEIGDVGTTLSSGVTSSLSLTATNHIHFRGTTYHAATQNYTVTTRFEMSAGAPTTFYSDGNVMTFQGGGVVLMTGSDLTMNTGGSNLTLGTIHAQPGNYRTLVLNAGSGTLNVGDCGFSGNGEFASTSFTASTLTLADVFADIIALNYTTVLNAQGDIVSTNTPLTFSNPVILQGTNTFSTASTTGANITFSSTLNGLVADTYGLTLNAGSGDINFLNHVGTVNRLANLLIVSADDVLLNATKTMAVDALVQLSGSGTTRFNGPLIVPGIIGIQLTGHHFDFNSIVTTLNNASLTVTNSGTLNFAGTANLSGAFTQTDSLGAVTLSGSITALQPILFNGPVTLSGSPSLSTAVGNQTITFANTLSGSGNLTMNAGSLGNIVCQADIGTSLSPMGALTINNCFNSTLQSVFATSITQLASTGTSVLNGTSSTSGISGIQLTGNNFTFNGPVITTGGGSCTITNGGILNDLSTLPHTIAGSYIQNGTGLMHFIGAITTNNGTISFASPLTLLGSSSFNSSSGNQDILFLNKVDGPGSLSLEAGSGNIAFSQIIGNNDPLASLTVLSAYDVEMNNIGTTASGVTGQLSILASHDIELSGTSYQSDSQNYSASNQTNLTAGSTVELGTTGGAITFSLGSTHLSAGSDLQIITNDGAFSFESIVGTSSEEILINTGSGVASLNTISTSGIITNLVVSAGAITFSGSIDPNYVNMTSLTTITNTSIPALIQVVNQASFNALGGDIGTLASPIWVQTSAQIFAGAGGAPQGGTANFIGSSGDNTVHEIPSNPPCIINFNGVEIQNCNAPPPPPPPPAPPVKPVVIAEFPFAVPGFESSTFNLASNYFFFSWFLTDDYLRRTVLIYSTFMSKPDPILHLAPLP